MYNLYLVFRYFLGGKLSLKDTSYLNNIFLSYLNSKLFVRIV